MRECNKCHTKPFPQEMFKVENENESRYWFCRPCTKQAYILLGMKLYINKEERSLMKGMRKFLNKTAN